MRIFLSYSSSSRATAEDVVVALQAEGHEVFFDKTDLPSAQSYIRRIRESIESTDLFIFLISPESITEGRFTLTELGIARKTWPQPAGRLLPVMIEVTPFDDIPAYLKSVTVLTPEGSVSAEVALAVADLENDHPGSKRKDPVNTDGGDSDFQRLNYEPLEVRFGTGAGSRYDVAVSEPPREAEFAGLCEVDAPSLEEKLWKSAGVIEGVARRTDAATGESSVSLLPSEADAQAVGASLFHSLAASPIRPGLDARVAQLDPQRGEGLRFLINMTEAPDLARLPWEFLYNADDDDFVFLDRMKTVIRTLDVKQPAPSLAMERPVRILVAVASPEGGPELRVGHEIARMDSALGDLVADGRVTIVRIDHTGLEDLDHALLSMKPHVLHFIGHGDSDGSDGMIMLEGVDGAPNPVSGRQLAVLLRNHLRSLRLVFLNSCLGAAVPAGDPFGGVAQNLIRRGVPAVIAMQFPVPDAVAVSLAHHLYRYLADGVPVDAALTSARAFLYASGYGVEWGAPALYMQTGAALVFDEPHATPAPLPVQAVPVPPPSQVAAPTPSYDAPLAAPAQSDDAPFGATGSASSAATSSEPNAPLPDASKRRALPWLAVLALLAVALTIALFSAGTWSDGAQAPATSSTTEPSVTTSSPTTEPSVTTASTVTQPPVTTSIPDVSATSSSTTTVPPTTAPPTTAPPRTLNAAVGVGVLSFDASGFATTGNVRFEDLTPESREGLDRLSVELQDTDAPELLRLPLRYFSSGEDSADFAFELFVTSYLGVEPAFEAILQELPTTGVETYPLMAVGLLLIAFGIAFLTCESRLSGRRLEHEHADDPVIHAISVVGVAGVYAGSELEDVVGLAVGCPSRGHGDRSVTVRDRRGRVSLEVVHPTGRRLLSEVRAEDRHVPSYRNGQQRHRPRLATLRSGGGQHDDGQSG